MDLWFIAFIIFGGITILVLLPIALFTRKSHDNDYKAMAGLALSAGLFVSVFLLFMSSFKIVGAKDIGVPVTFGRPSGSVMHNGWNWKNPMTTVHVFDGALQTEKFSADKEDAGDPIPVRLFTGSVAQVNVTLQWRLDNDDSVKQIYFNYRDPDKIN